MTAPFTDSTGAAHAVVAYAQNQVVRTVPLKSDLDLARPLAGKCMFKKLVRISLKMRLTGIASSRSTLPNSVSTRARRLAAPEDDDQWLGAKFCLRAGCACHCRYLYDMRRRQNLPP